MKSFENNRLVDMPIPMKIVRLLSVINEYKGKQDLYKQQSPQVLDTLKDVSIIQSTESSNRIEGIYTSNKRLKEIMEDKSVPQNRSESEIAGYRDVLNTIHSAYEAIPINSNIILQLHRDMYKYSPGRGGMWKTQDNVIEEVLPSGARYIRFKPVEAFFTPSFMDELCRNYNENRNENIGRISRGLKLLAKELDITVVALSQLSRALEVRANHRPKLSDLRDSGSLEQDADMVIFLYRDEYYNRDTEDPEIIEFIVAKHRNGETGTIKARWQGKYQKVVA